MLVCVKEKTNNVIVEQNYRYLHYVVVILAPCPHQQECVNTPGTNDKNQHYWVVDYPEK